jgi:hypothetical protein
MMTEGSEGPEGFMECADISVTSFCVQLASKCVEFAHSEHHFHLNSSFYHHFEQAYY